MTDYAFEFTPEEVENENPEIDFPEIDVPEDEPENVPEEDETGEIEGEALPRISGKRVSILDGELSAIAYAINDKLNRALRTAVEARQGFDVTAKISFSPMPVGAGVKFDVSHKVGYKFDPIKVEDKGELYDYLSVVLDDDGNPVIPDGGASQLTFDDVNGATVTTDSSGVVQDVSLDEDVFDRLFPCECDECPFHTGYTGGEEGCGFGGDVNAPLDGDMRACIYDAVTVFRCPRACIAEICAREFPGVTAEGGQVDD